VPFDPTTLGYDSTLIIEETGPAGPGKKPRRIVLLGSGLPFMGSEWAFENNVITTWYPGNPVEATQQNLGPRELPSTWQGDWRRTRLSRTPCRFTNDQGAEVSIIDPQGLREAFELIGRSGIRLRVTWSVNANEGQGNSASGFSQLKNTQILREGLIKNAHFSFIRHTDIGWTVEFNWASRGGTQDRVVSVRSDEDLDAASNALLVNAAGINFALESSIVKAKKDVRKSAVKFSLGQFEALANAPLQAVNSFNRQIQQNVSQIKQLGSVINTFRTQPAAITGSFINLAKNTQSIAINLIDTLGRQPPEVQANKTRVASLLRANRYFASVAEQARLTAESSRDLALRLRAPLVQRGGAPVISVQESQTTRAGQVLGVHVCHEGDTPQKVSIQYYKTPDHGSDILRANKLPLYQPSFLPGAVLIIPALGNHPSSL